MQKNCNFIPVPYKYSTILVMNEGGGRDLSFFLQMGGGGGGGVF